jgi:hypothetical protein
MGILENGASLVGNFIPSGLASVASRLIESIAINSIWEKRRRRRTLVFKRRNAHGEQLAELTNLYFRVANIPIRFWSKVDEWRRWEVGCFQMLNGDRFHAYSSGKCCVVAEKLPGVGLYDLIERGSLNKRMLQAAATELRRAHEFWTDEFRGRWSHGDATTQNVLYDAKTDRARLIDFEIVHDKSLPAATRQADDLLVFLLDMVGRMPSRKWIPFATTFLKAYGDAKVISELRKQLDLPGGLAWIWWGVRTNFTNPAKVKQRLANLSRAIRTLRLDHAAPAVRVRHKRRPSMNCQVINPGIPRPSSRRRVMSESAKALSPGIPRRPPTKT